MSITTVVNLRDAAFDVYIGRKGSSGNGYFGNPFLIGKDGNREEVIAKFAKYFYDRIDGDPEFRRMIHTLKGKKLGCFCNPRACHGDVIAEYLEDEESGREAFSYLDPLEEDEMNRILEHVNNEEEVVKVAVEVVSGLTCPTCGATEQHPTDKTKVLIRGCKVFDDGVWWSQCLVCAGYYDENLIPYLNNKDRPHEGGWFSEEKEA